MKLLKTAIAAAAIAFAAFTGAQADDAATYAALKTFSGMWVGKVTTTPKNAFDGVRVDLKIRVTSSGFAIVHEMGGAALQLGPEHMGDITVFYLEDGHVLATHYCDADTRSNLKAVPSAEPNTLAFDLVNFTGPTKLGYLSGITFKSITPDHHIEVIKFVMPDKSIMLAEMDLQRVKP